MEAWIIEKLKEEELAKKQQLPLFLDLPIEEKEIVQEEITENIKEVIIKVN